MLNKQQSTEDHMGVREQTAKRIQMIRSEMAREGLDAFLIPRGDEYMGEYVAICDERLWWLFNFSGSAGLGLVSQYGSALFVDGRYRVQAAQQLDGVVDTHGPVTILQIPRNSLETWIVEHFDNGKEARRDHIVGFDPWLHSFSQITKLQNQLSQFDIQLKAAKDNLVDRAWIDRPVREVKQVMAYHEDFAGLSSAKKRQKLVQKLSSTVGVVLITMSDSIAWLLNIRGSDVAYNPILHARVLLYRDGSVDLFCNLKKLSDSVLSHLGEGVCVYEEDRLKPVLEAISLKKDVAFSSQRKYAQILEDKRQYIQTSLNQCPYALIEMMHNAGGAILDQADPCQLEKAVKNATEFSGMRRAHIRDGVALCRFLCWLHQQQQNCLDVTELSAAKKMLSYREELEHYKDQSFETISAFGPNSAICHYRVTNETNRQFSNNNLYLIDSGAQYLDGTTDVTRTIAIGNPTKEMKENFTLVLKGHIQLATICFPLGITGRDLDVLARGPLWRQGKDYDHGTGHGVGAFLNVHEGPQSISSKSSDVALEAGMILSNEPGFYLDGLYGIRIENLVGVVKSTPGFDNRPMLKFETLTLAPIDQSLIIKDMLDPIEVQWLNSYHMHVYNTLSQLLDTSTREWLREQCLPLEKEYELI